MESRAIFYLAIFALAASTTVTAPVSGFATDSTGHAFSSPNSRKRHATAPFPVGSVRTSGAPARTRTDNTDKYYVRSFTIFSFGGHLVFAQRSALLLASHLALIALQ